MNQNFVFYVQNYVNNFKKFVRLFFVFILNWFFVSKKQVTAPGEDGKTVTHYFRQILLTRCQNEFENDYRQEIEYEKRKTEVETITDEKKRKEEGEKLEEDLVRAKRKYLGNIL
jgi:hypothetical protein